MNYTIQDPAGILSLPEALAAVNLSPPESPPLDGSWFRYSDPQHPKVNNKAAYLRTSRLPESGVVMATFGSWWREAQGIGGPWHWQSVPLESLSPEQREALELERAFIDSEYREARLKRQAEAADNARRMWGAAVPVHGPDHPYLTAKGVPGLGAVRLLQSTLLVPLFDVKTGDLCSLVRVLPDGTKYNLEGGRKAGCACLIGPVPATGGRVWVCEGIATGLSLHLATGDPVYSCGDAGNLAPVALALRDKLPTARLWIGGDNDQAGRQGAQKALQAVSGTRAVFPEIPGGQGSDFNDLHAAAGLEAVKAQLQAAATAPVEPEPLRREPPPPEAFPVEALGSLLGPACLAILESIQPPAPIAAASLLTGAALAVQPFIDAVIDGRRIPASLFLISVADSGERKTATDRVALAAHHALQKEAVAAYRLAVQAHKAEADAYEATAREARKAGGDPATLGAEPAAPLIPNLLVSDLTIEGLFRALATGKGSIGACSDEGATILSGIAFNRENRLKTVAGLCRLWDGAALDKARAGEGLSILYGRRCSLHVLAQAAVAETILLDSILQEQGFLARCLVAWPASTAGSRPYRAIDLNQDPRMLAYWERVRLLLSRPYPAAEEVPNELNPRPLSLTPAAKAVWTGYHDTIEAQLGDGQPLAVVRPFAAKAAELVLRLAVIFQHFEEPDSQAIEDNRISRAIALMDYYLTEAIRVSGFSGLNPDVRLAERLLDWARGFEVIHTRMVCQFGPNAIREAETAKRLCKLLEEHGWLSRIEGGAVIDGIHRRNAWRVCK